MQLRLTDGLLRVQTSTSGCGSAPATWSSATSSSTLCSSLLTSTLAVRACAEHGHKLVKVWVLDCHKHEIDERYDELPPG